MTDKTNQPDRVREIAERALKLLTFADGPLILFAGVGGNITVEAVRILALSALSLPVPGEGEPVAWRVRQLHHEIDGPITGWSYVNERPDLFLSSRHRWEIQPLYAHPAPAEGVVEPDPWALWAKHPQLSLQTEESDFEGDPLQWVAYRENGGRDDREWTQIAVAATPRAAVEAALAALNRQEGE